MGLHERLGEGGLGHDAPIWPELPQRLPVRLAQPGPARPAEGTRLATAFRQVVGDRCFVMKNPPTASERQGSKRR